MKQDHINYLAIGGFVLAMLFVLVYAVYKVTGQSANKDLYYVQYNNVTGVKKGTTVTYAGFPVGIVLDITPVRENGQTRYQLEFGIESGWPIPVDSTARIVRPGILTEQQINISEGSSSTLLKPGDTVKGLASVDLMALLNVMAGEFQDISDESLKPMIDNIGKHLDKVGVEVNKNVPNIAKSAGNLINNLTATSEQLSKLLNQENQEKLSSLFTNTNKMAQSLTRLTSSLDKASVQIEDLLSNSNKMLRDNNKDIRHSVVELRRSLDVVSQSIDTIVHNMSISSRNLNEITREIRANPGLLISGKPPEDKARE